MKKTILTTLLVFASSAAFASSVFTPVHLSEATTTNAAVAKPAATKTTTGANGQTNEIGNTKIQNAILQIDNAQTEISNQLLDLKTKYADVDAQYVSVKAQRKALKKQVSQAEKRLRALNSTKEKMRKNML